MSIKISQLSASVSVTGSDLIATVIDNSGSLITTKATISQVFNYITSSITDLTLNNITVLDNTILGSGSEDSLIVNATSVFNSSLTASDVLATGSLEVLGNTSVSTFTASAGYIANDLYVGGILTAQEYHAEFISASIIYESGSTKFGDTPNDIHEFTGSIYIDSGIISGSEAQFGNITGSVITGTLGEFDVLSGSIISASFGEYESLSGSFITGNIALFETVTGSSISGAVGQYESLSGSFITGNVGLFDALSGSIISGNVGEFDILSASLLTGNVAQFGEITSSFSGSGFNLFNLTSSNINNFVSDVRSQFLAGANIQIVSGTISVTGSFTGSGITTAVNTITSNTLLDNTYRTIYADAGGGSFIITLPSASSNGGVEYVIKRVDTSLSTIVTISGSPGDLIDGFTHFDLDYRYEGLTIQSDGTSSWYVSAEISSEIALVVQGYINPPGTNNLYIISGTAAGGLNKTIQFNDSGALNGDIRLVYDQSTNILSGVTAEFSLLSSSIISASQYVGVPSSSLPGGPNKSIQFNSGSELSGTYVLTYDYDTNILSGTTAHFTNIYAALNGTASYASDADKLDGLNSTAFSRLASDNTYTGFNVFNTNYITASVGITGSNAKFNILTASIVSASQYINVPTGSTVGGIDTTLQFNKASQLSGSENLKYNYTTNILSGTIAQFTTLTSSNVTGTSAFFSALSASNITGKLNNLTTNVSIVTANTFLNGDLHVVLASASVSNITVILPLAANSAYRQYIVKKIDPTVNKIIISGTSGQKIDGSDGRQITTQYETLTLISDGGTQWYIL